MRLKLICGSHHRLGSFTLHNVCLQGSYYLARKHRQAHSNRRRSVKMNLSILFGSVGYLTSPTCLDYMVRSVLVLRLLLEHPQPYPSKKHEIIPGDLCRSHIAHHSTAHMNMVLHH